MVEIKDAQPKDIAWLMCQAEIFAASYKAPFALMDRAHVYKLIEKLVAEDFFKIAEIDGVRAGLLGATVVPHVFNPQVRMAIELIWYVRKDYRSQGAGKALIESYVEWAKENADVVKMSLHSDTEVSGNFMAGMGFQFKEKSFMLGVR